jgi:hypothetical protein
VGGFVTKEGVQTFDGVMLGEDPTLSRADARAVIDADEILDMLKGVQDVVGQWELGWTDRLHFAQLFLNVGLMPESLACFLLPGGVATIEEVRTWLSMKAEGDEVVLVTTDAFEYNDSLGEREIAFDACQEMWRQPEHVIIVGETRSGALLPDLPRGPAEWSGPWGITRQQSPTSLARYVVEEAARQWGAEVSRLIEEGDVETRSIGTLRTDLGPAEITVECFVIGRPLK